MNLKINFEEFVENELDLKNDYELNKQLQIKHRKVSFDLF